MLKESEINVKSITDMKRRQTIQNKGKLEIFAQSLNENKK